MTNSKYQENVQSIIRAALKEKGHLTSDFIERMNKEELNARQSRRVLNDLIDSYWFSDQLTADILFMIKKTFEEFKTQELSNRTGG